MKVALVYTSTTPELIELVEKEVGDVGMLIGSVHGRHENPFPT